VAFGDYGHGTRHGIGSINRGIFLNSFGEWLDRAGIPQRLAGIEHPQVADLGCGTGWSTIVLGRHLPGAGLVGVDLDPTSVEDARANVQAEGRSAQIAIRRGDAADLAGGPFDLVTLFQMLHDSADPVGVLAAARRNLAPGGEVLLADEATADDFGDARGELAERFSYACSVLHCLPATMAEDPVEATGTVIRPSTIRRYAAEAGFTEVEELEVTPGFFRVFRLK
jgi:SAM-dependent methyltransferase